MAHSAVSIPSRSSVFAGLRARIAELREEWARMTVFRRTYDELSGYTDRQLADIGITRLEIVDLAKEAAWDQPARR